MSKIKAMYDHKKRYLAIALCLAPALSYAAEGAPTSSAGRLNLVLITMVGLAIVLLAIIGLAGNVLRQLSIVWKEKHLKEKSNSSTLKSIVLFALSSLATYTATAAEEQSAGKLNWDQHMISGIPVFDFYLILGIIALEFVVILCLLLYIRIFIKILSAEPEKAAVVRKTVTISFWDRFNKVVPIEKEADVMLDHNYDGIRELDNSLPPWWKYGFYLTIIISVFYLWRYHVSGNGPSSQEEYVAEVERAEKQVAEYLAKSANNVDENTVQLITEAPALTEGQKIFQASCGACHANDGGGGVGPNLTDDYWLHGGSLSDVFKSIKYGWQDKGMKAWKDDFSPRQIAELSSYIKMLRGTKPSAPKAPQGEIYTEQQAKDTTAKQVAIK
jgi:cytochrome c oxidase cbb3-type subunit 3